MRQNKKNQITPEGFEWYEYLSSVVRDINSVAGKLRTEIIPLRKIYQAYLFAK
jgi:hypothetical protein